MAKALHPDRIAGAFQREKDGIEAARDQRSATANGITPPAAINPMGDEICRTSFVMVCPDDSRPFAVFHRLTQLAIFSSIDEGQDFRNRWIGSRQILASLRRSAKTPGHETAFDKQSYHREALAGELAAFMPTTLRPVSVATGRSQERTGLRRCARR